MRDVANAAQVGRVTAEVTLRPSGRCARTRPIVVGTCLASMSDMLIDPVCNMPVGPDNAITTTHAGITYRFCSEPCRARFGAEPARYISGSATDRTLRREAGSKARSSPFRMVIAVFVGVAMVSLFAAPRTGIAGALPYLLLLACPLLHMVFHRGHRHDH